MPPQLMLDECDRIGLSVQNSLLEAWRLQFDRAAGTYNTAVLSKRIAACVAEGFRHCLDRDLQPPTQKQICYTTAVARELNVALSGDALRYKGSMTEFTGQLADDFKAQCARLSRFGGVSNAPEED